MALKSFVQKYAQNFRLTERETDVLYHLVNRVTSPADIGKILEISLYTVNNHLKKILEKTNVDSKTELLANFLYFLEQEKYFSSSVHPRVLILDDEPDISEMLKSFFTLKNIEAYTFSDPEQALDAMKKLKIDVVISDIRMPKLNGVAFLDEIRKLHHYEPGFIFISGHPEEYEMDTLLDRGAFAFMEKPLDLEKLYLMVWQYAHGSHSLNENEEIQATLGNIPLNIKQLGFGGFFLEHSQVQNLKRLENGSKVNLQFQLAPNEVYPATCEVVWSRFEGKPTDGYGMKFLEIPSEAKKQILEFVHTNNILSFIPKCAS